MAMPEDPTPQQWQLRPEAGGRLANRLLRPLAFGLGRPVARFITFFAALYFMLRRGPERAASRDYLGRILGRPAGWRDVYRHFLCFSTTVLDRVYLMADRFSRFDVQTVGLEALSDARNQGRGVLVLSAHLGSFDALRVMSLRNPDVSTRILLDVGQNAALSEMLNELNPKLASTIIDARRPARRWCWTCTRRWRPTPSSRHSPTGCGPVIPPSSRISSGRRRRSRRHPGCSRVRCTSRWCWPSG
jgi:predicted LPLAT superfamily acyltransferase